MHADYKTVREHTDYRSAKDGISNVAALHLVEDIVSEAGIEELRLHIGEAESRIVAVHAEEATGRNKIPMAYAEILASVLDLPTDPRIVQSSVANHGGAPSIYHRMVAQPAFEGRVEQGAGYVIVDDICTAGGTLANLKGFIETNGGVVTVMSVLGTGGGQGSHDIALASSTLRRLKYKHPTLDSFWRQEFGYGLEYLTEGEAGHLFAAPSVEAVRNRLAEAKRDLNLE